MALTHQFIGIFLGLINLKMVQLSEFKEPKILNSLRGKAGDFLRWDSCCQNPVTGQATDVGVLLCKCCSLWAVRGTQMRHIMNGF